MSKSIEVLEPLNGIDKRRVKKKGWSSRLGDILLGATLAILAGRLIFSIDHSKKDEVISNLDITEPGKQWKDNVRPIFPVKPWDISTDFPYPRKLEYEVSEGTWLRLDVHPRTGEIVFDMLGESRFI
jgi:hypothetical protein